MGAISYSWNMGHPTEHIHGLLWDYRDCLLFLSFNGEPVSSTYELGMLNYICDRPLRTCILSDLCEESVQGSCGGGFAVPDIIGLLGRSAFTLWYSLEPSHHPNLLHRASHGESVAVGTDRPLRRKYLAEEDHEYCNLPPLGLSWLSPVP